MFVYRMAVMTVSIYRTMARAYIALLIRGELTGTTCIHALPRDARATRSYS